MKNGAKEVNKTRNKKFFSDFSKLKCRQNNALTSRNTKKLLIYKTMIWHTKKNFSIFVAEIFIYVTWR